MKQITILLVLLSLFINARGNEYGPLEGEQCLGQCMFDHQCFDDATPCQFGLSNFLQLVSQNSVDSCWDMILLENQENVTDQQSTDALGLCYTDLAAVITDDEGKQFYLCGADCADNYVMVDDSESEEGNDWEEDDVCMLECYFGNNCYPGTDCINEVWMELGLQTENPKEQCVIYQIMMGTGLYTDEQLSDQLALCLQAISNGFDDNSDEKITTSCLYDCANNDDFPIDPPDEQMGEFEGCIMQCTIENDCLPYFSDCFNKNINLQYLQYYTNTNNLTTCQQFLDSEVSNNGNISSLFGQCMVDFADLHEDGSNEKNTILCFQTCSNNHQYEYIFESSEDEEDDDGWDWSQEDSWTPSCGPSKYCYYELLQCSDECFHQYCPDFICLDDSYEEYYAVSYLDSSGDCSSFNEVIFDIEGQTVPNQSVEDQLLGNYMGCSDFMLNRYSQNVPVSNFYQCHQKCSDRNQQVVPEVAYQQVLTVSVSLIITLIAILF